MNQSNSVGSRIQKLVARLIDGLRPGVGNDDTPAVFIYRADPPQRLTPAPVVVRVTDRDAPGR